LAARSCHLFVKENGFVIHFVRKAELGAPLLGIPDLESSQKKNSLVTALNYM